ncbi:hypothetical protein RCZ04_15210 [Capnocytophaga sp. HP1101]
MSRSRKKAIIKDDGIGRRAYHRIVRRHNGTILKTKIKRNILLDDTEIELNLKDAKAIVNSYNYCDYKTNWEQDIELRNRLTQEELNKWRRK